jgi:hypothetical protein
LPIGSTLRRIDANHGNEPQSRAIVTAIGDAVGVFSLDEPTGFHNLAHPPGLNLVAGARPATADILK